MKTKDKILAASLELFNRVGSNVVTTNHIAHECNISPGNLYYHFKNKEDIVLSLFQNMVIEFENMWINGTVESDHSLSFRILKIYEKYKFFQYDIVSLLRKNQNFKEVYMENLTRKKELIITFFRSLISKGFFVEMTEENLDHLFDLVWFISEFSFSFLEVRTDITAQDEITFLKNKYYFLVEPYLTEKGKKYIKEYF